MIPLLVNIPVLLIKIFPVLYRTFTFQTSRLDADHTFTQVTLGNNAEMLALEDAVLTGHPPVLDFLEILWGE